MKINDIREVSRRAKTELKIFIHHLMDWGYDSILGEDVEVVLKRAYPQYGSDILDHYEISIDHLDLSFKIEGSEVYAHFLGTMYLQILAGDYSKTELQKYPVKFKLKVFNDLNLSRINADVLEEIYLDIYTM
jgi:hypothetical protein